MFKRGMTVGESMRQYGLYVARERCTSRWGTQEAVASDETQPTVARCKAEQGKLEEEKLFESLTRKIEANL